MRVLYHALFQLYRFFLGANKRNGGAVVIVPYHCCSIVLLDASATAVTFLTNGSGSGAYKSSTTKKKVLSVVPRHAPCVLVECPPDVVPSGIQSRLNRCGRDNVAHRYPLAFAAVQINMKAAARKAL